MALVGRAIALLVATTMASGCADYSAGAGSNTFPAQPVATVPTDSGARARGTHLAASAPERGVWQWSTRRVVPWMPAMGHGASLAPVVTPEGGGKYVVSNVALFMAGSWQLRTNIIGRTDDSASVSCQIQ
jgi:hypothetical protein